MYTAHFERVEPVEDKGEIVRFRFVLRDGDHILVIPNPACGVPRANPSSDSEPIRGTLAIKDDIAVAVWITWETGRPVPAWGRYDVVPGWETGMR